MANWIHNNMTMKHSNQLMMDIAISAWNRNQFLRTLVPEPAQRCNASPDGNSFLSAESVPWCEQNWGTKSDIDTERRFIEPGTDCINVSFGSAWTPPIDAYHTLSNLGFEIEAFYFIPEERIVGSYSDAEGSYSQYVEKWSENWLRAHVNPRLIEEFDLIENSEFLARFFCEDDVDSQIDVDADFIASEPNMLHCGDRS